MTDQDARTRKGILLLSPVEVPPSESNFGCGAQALAAAAAHVQRGVNAEALARALGIGPKGANAVDILLAARRQGLHAKLRRGDWDALRASVAADLPTLVIFDSRPNLVLPVFGGFRQGEKVFHWAVVSGVSDRDRFLLLAAPDHRHVQVGEDDFLARWRDTGFCSIQISLGKDSAQ